MWAMYVNKYLVDVLGCEYLALCQSKKGFILKIWKNIQEEKKRYMEPPKLIL